MQDSTWYVIAMIVYLLAMAAIGYWSYKQTFNMTIMFWAAVVCTHS